MRKVHGPPNDARWLRRPFGVGLTALLGVSRKTHPFLLAGVDFDYALRHVSVAGTLGYQSGLNAALSARYRFHVGRAVALTLGGRAALVPLSNGGCLLESIGIGSSADPHNCAESHWHRALFAGGELGIEGRSADGFMWRTGMGLMGLVSRGGYWCSQNFSYNTCEASPDNHPGLAATTNVTVGYAF